jgi:uncharacterized protein (TIGR04255 family)
MPGTGVYPNAPLVETVFEIRFSGEPAIECHRDEFYESVRARFPKVLVPQVGPGQFPALTPYHFRSADEKTSLMTAINRFAYSTRSYDGFASFKEQALSYMSLFGERFRLRALTRTGLRYINIIPFNREGGLLPIERYFRLRVELPSANPSLSSNISFRTAIPTANGSLTLRLECVTSSEQQEAFLLDFDYAKISELSFDRLAEYLDESHAETKMLFENIITDEYRKFMTGEVVE